MSNESAVDILILNQIEADVLVPSLIARWGEGGPALTLSPGEQVPPLAARGLAGGGFEMSIVSYLRALTQAGPKYVIVTDGARGAFVGSHDEILFSPALETKIVGTAGLVMLLVLPLRHTWRSAVVSTKRSAQQRQIRHRWSRTWILKQACCDVTNSIRRLQHHNEPLEDGLYSCRFKSRMLSL